MKKFNSLLIALIFAVSATFAQKARTISGSITSDVTFFSDTIYTLDGYVFVKNNATLTIQPGTIVKGKFGNKSTLVITRNGKIIANGTANQPIVFTSEKLASQRAKGDWGGVVILGKAILNRPTDCSTCPGTAIAANEAGIQNAIEGDIDNANGDGLYGGTDSTHNAGILKFVRIEFAGTVITPGNEINGLTMGGLGSATTIENVQVSFADDDGFEWFGGSVNAKWLVSNRNVDDDLDVDFGFKGKIQFAIVLRDSNLYDIGSGPTTNGFESDNDGTGTEAKPFTDPTFSNVTVVGPLANGTALSTANSFQNGARIRRNSSTSIFNSIIMGYPDGLFIDGTRTGQKFATDSMMFRNNILAGNLRAVNNASANVATVRSSIFSQGTDSLFSANGVLTNAFNYTNPNFLPATGSVALSGAAFTAPRIADSYFTPTTYRGAMGTDDWTKCWCNFNPNAANYDVAPLNNFVPIVDAGNDTTICIGKTATIGKDLGVGYSYSWSPIAGLSNATIARPVVNVATTTKYFVTVTDNATGCKKLDSITVTIAPLPTATATAATTTTFCAGGSVVLNANTGTGLTYQWLNNNAPIATATNASYTATASGNYRVLVSNASGCKDTSTAVAVIVNTIPTITASTPAAICGTGTAVLGATASAGTINWYLALTGGTATSTGAFFTTPNIAATTTYYADATANGCTTATRTAVTATVNAIPTITASTPAAICGTGSAVLGATASAGTINWYAGATGGTSVSTGASFTTPSITATTNYFVDATANGCTTASRTSVTATVNPNLTSSVSISSNTTAICGSAPITFTATPTNGGASPSYQWKRNGVNVGIGTNTYVLSGALTADSVYAVMTSNATPCLVNVTSNSNGIVLTSSTVTPTVAISANPGTTVCNGTSVTFTANATNGGASPSYQWIRNGVNVGTNLSTFTSATLVTNDSISVVLTSNAACISSPTATSAASVMTVNAIPTITASTPASRCGTGTLVLGATASAGTINWYPDLTGGTSIATGVSYTTPSITATTTYFVDATANGCTTATRTSVAATINALPTVDFSSSLGSNGSVSFLNSSTNAATYSWSFGDGGTSTIANPTRQYTTNGTFQVKLIVTSANGCVAQLIKQIIVTGINSPVKALSGEITANTTLFRDTIYTLNGYVFVKNNATITIQSGTIIKGGADKASLIITRNGKIEANGTKNQPIVFTSAKASGQRAKGDWGGLIILGKARLNRPTDCSTCPGSAIAATEPGIQNGIEGDIDNANGDGLYGGTDDTHNAGTLKYVRLEYGGTVITPGNEINGLTMGGLGSGTTIENVQVSFADDDGFEWFGGTVNGRNLISFRNVDDDLDVDFGFTGKVQNAIVLRDSNLYDIGSGPTTNGFESDNDGTGTESKPYTDPTFSNVTIVGPLANGTPLSTSNSFQNGARIRRNSSTSIFNSIIMGFPDGLFVDGTRTGQKFANDSMMFRNNILAGNLRAVNNSSANASSVRASIVANGCDTLTSANGVLANPFNYTNPNFTPAPSSLALTGASFTTTRLSDPFFKQTPYRGALSPNPDSNWTNCWSNFDPQMEGYTSAPYNRPGALAGFTAANGTGRTVNFTNNSSNAIAYFWNFGVNNSTTDTSVEANPSFVYPSNGTYNVVLTALSPCGNAIFNISVVVNDASSNPVADFTYVQTSTTGSREFTFTNTSDEKGFGTTYHWDFGVASSTIDTSTAKNPVYTFPASGTYTVTLIATGTAGADTISKVLNVIPVGIEENSSTIGNVILYPNPTDNLVNISFDLATNEDVSVNIYDMSGKLVKSIPSQSLMNGSYEMTIETSELSQGVYFTNISSTSFSKNYRLVIIK